MFLLEMHNILQFHSFLIHTYIINAYFHGQTTAQIPMKFGKGIR